MIRVLIQSAALVERSGRNARGDWKMREQIAWVFYANPDGEEPFPTKLLLRIDDGGKPYPPGEYQLAPWSFSRGDYDSMIVRRVELVPAVSHKAAA